MKNFNIKQKLLLASLTVLGLLLFLSGYTILHEKKMLMDQAREDGHMINSYLARICLGAMKSYDFDLIQSYLVEASENEVVASLTVYDANNTVVATTRDRKNEKTFNEKTFIEENVITHPIVSRKLGEIGRVETVLSFKDVNRHIWSMVRRHVIFSMVSLCLIIIVAVKGAHSFTRPLSLLIEGIGKVRGGDLDSPVKIVSRDEIGLVGQAFNEMREKLKNTLQELKDQQQGLELLVYRRTEELEESNAELQETQQDLLCQKDEIEKNRNEIKMALDEVSNLISRVSSEGKYDIFFSQPVRKKCWEELQCAEKECPCFGKDPLRCWQMIDTLCKGKKQGDIIKKRQDCLQCRFYKDITSDNVYRIGEEFNHMMNILNEKNKKLIEAFKQLGQSQSTIVQQEKMASVGQLAAGVAHEINNPIGFIMSNMSTMGKYVDRLKEFDSRQSGAVVSGCSPESIEDLRSVRKGLKVDYIFEDMPNLIRESLEGAERVREIVQNLKSFSRLDEAERKPANINECLENTLKIVWNELKYKCKVIKEYGELPLTLCSAQKLNQVFVNLLVNASHAIEKQGDITIRTWAENNSIYVAIADTGCGIPEENLPRLFEPFFTTKEVGKGTGLGLSIVYDIVTKNHQGEIKVESEVGKGSVFTIRLPVVEG